MCMDGASSPSFGEGPQAKRYGQGKMSMNHEAPWAHFREALRLRVV